jgi:signal transduction histidine kinase
LHSRTRAEYSAGLDPKVDLDERLAFLDLGDADLRLLAEIRPLLQRHADRFVAAFYRHLLSFDETRHLLADPEVKDRLLGKQREYLLSLAPVAIDEDYLAERVRIGTIHERIGLDTRWYLGAYALYFSLLAPVVCDVYQAAPDRGQRVLASLVKLLMLDAQLALGAYIERREHELEHLNRELAAAGRSLAREVEEQDQELRQTTRRARAAEDLASAAALVAGLAHEIGTPMGVIRGHAEALEGAVEGERAQWRLRTIRTQIDRISEIIQALLNIARPRELVRVPVDLGEVVETSLAFLSEKLGRRGVEVERSLGRVPEVLGDPDKLQQLFLNLFLNAIDAMPDGGTLSVRLRRKAAGVEVAITDTGLGIPPEDLEHVFEPFYTTKPAGRGSGLGLVVVRGIVADHGGTIELTSETGRGTCFQIFLPAGPLAPDRPADA